MVSRFETGMACTEAIALLIASVISVMRPLTVDEAAAWSASDELGETPAIVES